MEQTTVTPGTPAESNDNLAPANVFSFGPETDYESELMQTVDAPAEETEPAAERPGTTGSPTEQTAAGAEPPAGVGDPSSQQKDIGAAFSAERKRQEERYRKEYEEKLAKDKARNHGLRMIEDIMQREGKSFDEAADLAEQRWYAALAKRDNVPETVLRKLDAVRVPEPANQQAQEIDTTVADIFDNLKNAKLPADFPADVAYKDPAFAELLLQAPVDIAIRTYNAEYKAKNATHAVADQLRARQQVPAPMRTSVPATAELDLFAMTDEEFDAFKERRRKS